MDLTQGGSHQDRPKKEIAEDVVLYTYLLLGEFAEVYLQNNSTLNDETVK